MTDTDVQLSATRHSFRGRDLAWWCLSFVGFPIGGLVAEAIVGPIDEVWSAVIAGAIAGAAIGAAQWFSLRQIGLDASTSGLFVRRNGALAWIGMTAAGLALGLGVGVAIFDYGTSVGDLAVLGAASGLGVGAAQWLDPSRSHRGRSPLDRGHRRSLGARVDHHHVHRCRCRIEVGSVRCVRSDHRDRVVWRPALVPHSPEHTVGRGG